MDIAPNGEVYVVDDVRDDVQVFTPRGTYLRTLGRGHGSLPGQMSYTGMARVRSDGVLVNADFGNDRVQAIDASGRSLWSFGSHGGGPGQFDEPQDIAFGPTDILFVVDDSRVQVFDRAHELIGEWPGTPSSDHLGSLALIGDRLWVEPPYTGSLIELQVTYT